MKQGPRNNRRRQNRQRRNGRQLSKGVKWNFVGVPDSLSCKLRYVTTYDFSGTPFDEVLIRGNGPYDPEVEIGGGQPLYYDQIGAMYDKVLCYSSKLKVTFMQRTASTESAFVNLGMYPIKESSEIIDIDLAMERKYGKTRFLGPNTGYAASATMTTTSTTASMFGIEKSFAENDMDFQSSVSALPFFQWYWHIYAGTVDSLANIALYAKIEVEYECKFMTMAAVSVSLNEEVLSEQVNRRARRIKHITN